MSELPGSMLRQGVDPQITSALLFRYSVSIPVGKQSFKGFLDILSFRQLPRLGPHKLETLKMNSRLFTHAKWTLPK